MSFDFKIRKCNIAKDYAILRTGGESIIGLVNGGWGRSIQASIPLTNGTYHYQWIDMMVGSEQSASVKRIHKASSAT